MRKLLKAAAWGSWFSWCFAVFAVITFPIEGLRPVVIEQTERALGKGKQGVHGTDPVVTIGELGMSGLGVKATRVALQLANHEPEPGPLIELDSVRVPLLPLLSLLSDKKRVAVDLELYDGDISASVTLDDKRNILAAGVDIDDVDLGRATVLGERLGLPVQGKLSAEVDLDMGAQPEKDAKGQVKLAVKGLGLGAGNLKLVPGGFELPEGLRLGDLKGSLPIKQGQGTVEALRFEGGTDIEAEVTGTVNIKSRWQASRLDVEGWFRPASAFLEKNPKVKSALELGEKLSLPGAPSLSKAKDEEGRYHFNARGALQTVRPQLARDNGRKVTRGRPAKLDPVVQDDGPSSSSTRAPTTPPTKVPSSAPSTPPTDEPSTGPPTVPEPTPTTEASEPE
jgi:type II secretion system protein N